MTEMHRGIVYSGGKETEADEEIKLENHGRTDVSWACEMDTTAIGAAAILKRQITVIWFWLKQRPWYTLFTQFRSPKIHRHPSTIGNNCCSLKNLFHFFVKASHKKSSFSPLPWNQSIYKFQISAELLDGIHLRPAPVDLRLRRPQRPFSRVRLRRQVRCKPLLHRLSLSQHSWGVFCPSGVLFAVRLESREGARSSFTSWEYFALLLFLNLGVRYK